MTASLQPYRVVLSLGRVVPDSAGKPGEWAVHRELNQTDWDSAKRSLGYLVALEPDSALGKVEEARLDLIELSGQILGSEKLHFSSAHRIGWAKALEEWLTQFVAVRRRFHNSVKSVLGESAAGDMEGRFRKAFKEDPAYRLVWELRNLSEHGHQVLNLTSKSDFLDASNQRVVEWKLPIQPVIDALGQPANSVIAGLWSGTAEVEMGWLIAAANKSLHFILASTWNAHEAVLRSAANDVLALIVEAETLPGAPALMRFERHEGGTMETQMNPLFRRLPLAMFRALDESREIVSQQG